MTPQKKPEEAQPNWPRLRRCLKLDPVADEDQPFPSVLVTDPVRGKYFKAGWPLSGLLLLWSEAENAADLIAKMQQTYGAHVTEADMKLAFEFLFRNELSETDDKGGWQRFKQNASASRHGVLKALMHNYLFFRIPLLHPDAMLRVMLPYLRFAFRPWFWSCIAGIAGAGLYLTSRQWSDVVAAIHEAMQFQQVFIYATALFLLKTVHELGHAITCVYYGCRVPSMGMAFMLGTPVLYTDTTDSWRLSNHNQRLAIVFAGVAAESIVAALAILAWPLLPDGSVRHICFSFATASVATSLAVNLNPLMRYDGYFALSDHLRVPNLQSRAFALGSWKLREVLFGISAPPPETFPPRKQLALLAYAYSVWVYRFFLYLGIAYIVYVMAGKAIGIVLGLFELVVFILLPIWKELRAWWKMRERIGMSRRAWLTAAACSTAAIAFFTPCLRSVESPGVLVAGDEQEIHVPEPARVTAVSVREGQQVKAGDLLFEAVSPDLDQKLRKARLEARLLELRLSRLIASPKDHEGTVVLKREFKAAREKYEGLQRQRRELHVTAPFDGRIVDLDTAVATGTWVSQDQLLARIATADRARVKAVIADTDLHRIQSGAHGVFVSDEADLPSQAVTLETIAPASDGKLAEATLADLHGGPVASMTSEHTLKVREGWVEAVYTVPGPAPSRLVRGTVVLDAEPQSPASVLWRRIGRVLIREQGF